MRVGTQGLFHLYLKTFVALFLPARLTAPGSPRMDSTVTVISCDFFLLKWRFPLKVIVVVKRHWTAMEMAL